MNQQNQMTPAERAKQFLPFAAVRGLDEALRQQEKKAFYQARKELSEERKSAINAALLRLKRGIRVLIVAYADGEYRAFIGQVRKNDPLARKILLEDGDIAWEDLWKIRILPGEG